MIRAVMGRAAQIGKAVIKFETVDILNLNDVGTVGNNEFYAGKLRCQTYDKILHEVEGSNVEVPQEIELRTQLPSDPSQHEVTLKFYLEANTSKNDDIVFFNNIEKLSDMQAYFEGFKFTLADLKTV